MAVHSITTAIDNLATTTLHRTRRQFADAVFKASKFAFFMLAKGRVQTESGGLSIREPLIYGKNQTVKSYSGYDRLDVFPTEELTQAAYNWKLFAGTVSISGDEELKNSGAEAILNLLKAKIMVANKSMKEQLNTYLVQTQNFRNSKDFLSLDNLVEDVVGTSQSTVGGINRATYTWWRNKFKAGSLASVTSEFRTFYNNVSEGMETPDLIFTNQETYEAYEDQNAGKLRLSDTSLMQVGFENLRFKGATMMWDTSMSDTAIRDTATFAHQCTYFLNTAYLRMVMHRQRQFVMSKFVQPYDQDARVAQILVAGNLTLANSRYQGALRLS
tara:strand:+ start:1442 stop:2428 length:987 start_codon:yes stop_codon:yes gene_type:complete